MAVRMYLLGEFETPTDGYTVLDLTTEAGRTAALRAALEVLGRERPAESEGSDGDPGFTGGSDVDLSQFEERRREREKRRARRRQRSRR
jgi:hypothetical protein